jgi:type IV pilus assembly protein PilQ
MKRHVVGVILALTLALVPLAALSHAPPGPPGPAGSNVVSRLSIAAEGDVTAISIQGSQEPLFTAFRMDAPPRLVIDIAHASIEGAKTPDFKGSAAVTEVATFQFANAGNSTGRVVVGVKDGVTYDARAQGAELVIQVAPKGVALPPFKFASAGSMPAAAGAKAEPKSPAAAPAATAAAGTKAADPKGDGNPGAKTEAEPDAKTPAGGVPEYSIKPDAAAVRPVTVKEIKTRRLSDEKVEVVVALDGAAAFGVMEVPSPGRLVLDIPSGTAARTLKRSLDLEKGPVSKVRVGVHDDKLRLVMDLRGAMPAYDVKSSATALKMVLDASPKTAAKTEAKPAAAQPDARPPAVAAATVKAATPAAVPETKPGGPAAKADPAPTQAPKVETKTAKPVSVEDIAFRQYEGYSRVAVRLSKGADYRVVDGDGLTTALEIKDGALKKELERTLDVSEVNGPVESISSFSDGSRGGAVMIVAKLREKVKGRLTAEGNEIFWDFARQTATAGKAGEVVEYSQARTAGATSTVATATGTAASGKVYKGKRISLDFKDADIHNILRLISEVSKLNIVTSDDVRGRVTVTLRNVPWDEALDIILQAKGLGKKQVGNIIRVGPLEQFQKEAEIELARKKAERLKEPLYVRLIPVNYGVASEIVAQVRDVLSERGTVNIDQRTNVIIVKDMQENVIKAEGLIRNLDTQTPQVLIEARIVEANTTFVRDIGIQWGGNLSFSPANGNNTGLKFPNVVSIAGGADDSRTLNPMNGTMNPAGFAINMPAPVGAGSGGAIGFIFGSAGGTANLNLRLSAMENTGDVKILSAPRVTTLDNKEAKIGSGISIPISTVSAAGINTVFIEAKLELSVTPHVTQDGSILMKINTTKNEPDFSRTGASGDPTIIKKEATTEVLVKDGDTTVIGGIYTRRNSEELAKVPLLANIPVIGWLFKKRRVADERTELLIFITPRIINRSQATVSSK